MVRREPVVSARFCTREVAGGVVSISLPSILVHVRGVAVFVRPYERARAHIECARRLLTTQKRAHELRDTDE